MMIMISKDETDMDFGLVFWIVRVTLLILIAGQLIAGASLHTDKEVLLQLKTFLKANNRVNGGPFNDWGDWSSPPSLCGWEGIECNRNGSRVTGIHLSGSNISGKMFHNYSALTELSALDLSCNTIEGPIPPDLIRCKSLRYLNLSHNILEGELNLGGLDGLIVLDLTRNRFEGSIQFNFPAICRQLVTLNLSSNNFTGELGTVFDECSKLKNLDLSYNNFTGSILSGFARLTQLSISENNFTGEIPPALFSLNCSLEDLDLSGNRFYGQIPKEVSNCRRLSSLSLWGNRFTGKIPSQIGSLSSLQLLNLGRNCLSREIPESLQNCSALDFLDLSNNNFGGSIQDIFGRLLQLKFLILHKNNYTGGMVSSGILKLPNILRLDLSFNLFSQKLPIEITEMRSLKFLILANNQFFGSIPHEIGRLSGLQALDLSFNSLSGMIPPSIGNLTSLLWLMLSNNSISGEIPKEIGKCSSLLWLNLANNGLTGRIPAELSEIGKNSRMTFKSNQQTSLGMAGTGECLAMKRWIPIDYPPFSFVYAILNRKICKHIWEQLLNGHGLFPICSRDSSVRKLVISGYLQLAGNRLTGEIPDEIGEMKNFSLFHLALNRFSGSLTPSISRVPVVFFNLSSNEFSGPIPPQLGELKCLQSLDLSFNNFSGELPVNLNSLAELSRFNISYNRFLSGKVPTSGQLATFGNESFIGDPWINLGISNAAKPHNMGPSSSKGGISSTTRKKAFLTSLSLFLAFFTCGVLSAAFFLVRITPRDTKCLLEQVQKHDTSSTSASTVAKVFHMDASAPPFTYEDIIMATGNFDGNKVIGKGGYGLVYSGVLQDGRKVAVKKLQREGKEGETEFKAEMQVLSRGNGGGWPHPNLVMLFGWCLFGSDKILVYEFMEGGSLDEVVMDWERLKWAKRLEVAVGVARALAFLHHDCFPSIVHRDVKASNVLLDNEGRPRVTDFGLARVVRPGESHVTTMVAGTVGYVAPEYGHTWQATTKGDVYSYGVLLLELSTGRRAMEEGGEECLVEWVSRVAKSGRGIEGTLFSMPRNENGEIVYGLWEMSELLKIGLICTAEAPQARPNMKQVLDMLARI